VILEGFHDKSGVMDGGLDIKGDIDIGPLLKELLLIEPGPFAHLFLIKK
jgi:hypothetical protein